MSRGLILGSMGRAVADAGSTMGNMMMRSQEDEQRRADREREREEQRQYQTERDALYRKPAGESSGRGGTSAGPDGIPMEKLESGQPGGQLAGRSLGLTDPELAAYDEAAATGDFSKFKTGKKPGKYGDAGPEQMEPEAFEAARAAYPPGVSDESIRAKIALIADMRTSLTMGKDNESFRDGERTRQKIGATKEVMKDPGKAGTIGRAIAAGDGDGAFGKGNVDQFSGAPDQIGQSAIRENNAQAAKAGSDSKSTRDGTRNESLKGLTQERIAADSAAKEAMRDLESLRDQTKNVPLSERGEHKAKIAAAEKEVQLRRGQRDDWVKRINEFSSGGSGKAAEKPATPSKPGAARTTKNGTKITPL